MKIPWSINTMLLPMAMKKMVKTYLPNSTAFQYTRNRRTYECCIGSSKNISTVINSLQSFKQSKEKNRSQSDTITFMVTKDTQTHFAGARRAQCPPRTGSTP